MNLEVNIDVISNSNPTFPASEFLIEIPLDEEVPEPLPNTHCEVLAPVNNLESASSESDLLHTVSITNLTVVLLQMDQFIQSFHLQIILTMKIIQKMISIR